MDKALAAENEQRAQLETSSITTITVNLKDIELWQDDRYISNYQHFFILSQIKQFYHIQDMETMERIERNHYKYFCEQQHDSFRSISVGGFFKFISNSTNHTRDISCLYDLSAGCWRD
jgi:hypothetical protein